LGGDAQRRPGHRQRGSGELVQSLVRRNLVDEYVLLFHPQVLGSERRLFTDGGASAALRLAES
jgi:dihydrofolate reductase